MNNEILVHFSLNLQTNLQYRAYQTREKRLEIHCPLHAESPHLTPRLKSINGPKSVIERSARQDQN